MWDMDKVSKVKIRGLLSNMPKKYILYQFSLYLTGMFLTKSCDNGSLSRVSRASTNRQAREGSEV